MKLEKKSYFAGHEFFLALWPIPVKTASGDSMHLSVSDATKICVLPASLQSFPNGAPLQTTHPCGALSVPQIHHNAFDKTPVTLFKKK